MSKINSGKNGIHTWLILWKATRAMEKYAHRSIGSLGLGVSDFGVLEALLHKGPLPVSALGSKVLLASSSMTAAVDRLEAQGLVARGDDPGDRRARIVRLTKKGNQLITRAFEQHAKDMERAMFPLEEDEQATLVALLRTLGRHAAALTGIKEMI